jgi:multiple antibiotic resistance protein
MKYLQATVTMLSLINPLVSAAILSRIEAGQPRGARFAAATKGAVAILIVLSASALIGARLLGVFGVSLDVFQVAGGAVLAWMGFSMLRGAVSQTTPSAVETRSLAPLILFAASPGTITGVITLSVNHARLGLPVTALVGTALAVLVTWIVLLLAGLIQRRGGAGLLHDLTTRFMGIIVLAMGFQFGLAGLKAFFETG